MSEGDSPRRTDSTWAAVAWAEGISLVGLILLAIAVVSSVQDCTVSLGCANDSSISTGAVLLLAAIGLIPLGASSLVAAHLSGWQSPNRVAASSVAAFFAVLALGALVSGRLPALVLALAVQAGVAVRPPSRRAVTARVVVIALLVVLAFVVASGRNGVLFLLVLLAIPSIGVADRFSGQARARRRAA
jgi:hypothetical protein